MLSLVDRVVVIVDHKIMLDGPKDPVLKKLQEKNLDASQQRSTQQGESS